MIDLSHIPALLYREEIDGRCGIPSLINYVYGTGRDPRDGFLYVFSNAKHNILKSLWYDGDSFWLLQRKLTKGTFSWVMDGEDEVIAVNREEIENLLRRLPIHYRVKKKIKKEEDPISE